jgi:hypothetical protein
MKRFGSTRWDGGLREGKGAVSIESRALENYAYSFLTRYGDKPRLQPLLCRTQRVSPDHDPKRHESAISGLTDDRTMLFWT